MSYLLARIVRDQVRKMSGAKSPLLETQMPKMPPVVRLELPYALELLAVLEELELLQDESKKALAKFKQRVLEAESRS